MKKLFTTLLLITVSLGFTVFGQEIRYFQTTAAGLRLRENPALDSTIITSFAKYTILIDLNEQTLQTQTINQRSARWHKVSVAANPALTGWVFGAYIDEHDLFPRNYQFQRNLNQNRTFDDNRFALICAPGSGAYELPDHTSPVITVLDHGIFYPASEQVRISYKKTAEDGSTSRLTLEWWKIRVDGTDLWVNGFDALLTTSDIRDMFSPADKTANPDVFSITGESQFYRFANETGDIDYDMTLFKSGDVEFLGNNCMGYPSYKLRYWVKDDFLFLNDPNQLRGWMAFRISSPVELILIGGSGRYSCGMIPPGAKYRLVQ